MNIYTIALISLLCLNSAFSKGHETGNGGAGIHCPNDAKKVHLLDFWEGQIIKGLNISMKDEDVVGQVESLRDQLTTKHSSSLADNIITFVQYIYRFRMMPVPDGVELLPPADTNAIYMPKGCHPIGLANYNDRNNTIDYDASYFNELEKTEQAGLLFHEAIYRYLRDNFSMNNSVVARNITACYFADHVCEELSPFHEIPKNHYYVCQGRSETNTVTRAVVYFHEKKITNTLRQKWGRVQITHLNDKLIPIKTYFDVKDVRLTAETLEAPQAKVLYSRTKEEFYWRSLNQGMISHAAISLVDKKLKIDSDVLNCQYVP